MRTRICLEGWYFLAIVLFIAGGAILGEVNLLLALTGMLVGPLLFNWRFVQLSLRQVEVTRRLPWRVNAGETLTIDFNRIVSRDMGAVGLNSPVSAGG